MNTNSAYRLAPDRVKRMLFELRFYLFLAISSEVSLTTVSDAQIPAGASTPILKCVDTSKRAIPSQAVYRQLVKEIAPSRVERQTASASAPTLPSVSERVHNFAPLQSIQSSAATRLLPATNTTLSVSPSARWNTNRKFCNTDLIITKTRDLSFGTVITGTKSGTVTAPPIGRGMCTGAVILEPNSAVASAQFQYSNTKDNDQNELETDDDLSIILPKQAVLTRQGGTETLLVDGFNYVIDHNTIDIGATLHFNPNQVYGSYSGQFLITVIEE